MRSTWLALLALVCLPSCEQRLELVLNPQPSGLLDGLSGSVRVYQVDASFECPGRVLAGGALSTRWPDACTDDAMEPLVRSPALGRSGSAVLVREVAVAGATPTEAVGEIAPGRYAFIYAGTGADCDIAALGCDVVDFPANITIDIAPPVAAPPDGPCLTGCATRDVSACTPCGP